MIVRADGRKFGDDGVNVAVSTKMEGDQTGYATRHEVSVFIAHVGRQVANGLLENCRALAINDDQLKTKLNDVIDGLNALESRVKALEVLLAMPGQAVH